jgi:hypothetical protein
MVWMFSVPHAPGRCRGGILRKVKVWREPVLDGCEGRNVLLDLGSVWTAEMSYGGEEGDSGYEGVTPGAAVDITLLSSSISSYTFTVMGGTIVNKQAKLRKTFRYYIIQYLEASSPL